MLHVHAMLQQPQPLMSTNPIRYIWEFGKTTKSRDDATTITEPTPTPPRATGTVMITLPSMSDVLDSSVRNRAVFFLNRALVRDIESTVFDKDVFACYRQAFAKLAPINEVLLPDELMDLLLKIFKGAKKEFTDVGINIKNVAWRGQTQEELAARMNAEVPSDDPSCKTFTVHRLPDPEDDHIPVSMPVRSAHIHTGRKLAHLPEPARTRYWLRMFFEAGTNHEVDEASIWRMYEMTFKPCYSKYAISRTSLALLLRSGSGTRHRRPQVLWKAHADPCTDEHPHLGDTEFVECISKVFKDAEEVQVAPQQHVIWLLKPRDKPRKASDMLKRYDQEQLGRTHKRLLHMQANGHLILTPKLNVYQKHMLETPILCLPPGEPSPWLQRLRRRTNGGSLGDYQPGFPGISIKKISRQWKKTYAEAQRVAEDAQRLAERALQRSQGAEEVKVAQSPAEQLRDVLTRRPVVGKRLEEPRGMLRFKVDAEMNRVRGSSVPPTIACV